MRTIKFRLKTFFFPPTGTPFWLRLAPYAVLGIMTLFLLTAGAYGWEYTNSPEFCGTSCHTMPPEYTAYQVSPHARIACVDCHIGKGFIATRITRKAGDLKHVTATLFKNYEFPIRADELRPARETCELCHFPEKFSDDSLREIQRYQNDKNNTPISLYLTLKTGGGSERLGLGRGIHWHIQNPVYYLPEDPEEQKIPYVRVVMEDGSIQEYIDVGSDFDPSTINEASLKEMDCITCHNRITHLVPPPEDTVDELISRGMISAEIPDIRRQAVSVYERIYDSTEKGLIGISGLEGYYREYYPEYFSANREKISQAVEALQEAYGKSVFPEQNSDWSTHPNNIGHKDSPGCFRCHDGKHLDRMQQAVRLECNLCHSIPVVAGPDDFVAEIEISRGPEPESHRNANWISFHNQIVDQTCSNCHTTEDPGGVSNTSFCSNSACHGSAWTYAGFDAPGLREILESQLPLTPTPSTIEREETPVYNGSVGQLLQTRCGSCHGENGMQGLNLTSYRGVLEGGQNGPAIIIGDSNAGLLIQKQTADLPHFSQLTAQELALIAEWIEAGAPEN